MVVAALQSPHAKAKSEVMDEGLRAMANIAFDNEANQTQLGELGACVGEQQ